MLNKKIKDLRAFLSETLQRYDYEKLNLNDNEFADSLKITCYFIEEKIISTIEYYQYNQAPITEIENAKGKCKDLTDLLNKYKNELIELGIYPNEYLSFKKDLNDAFDFELSINTKELLPNYLEIENQFLDVIKIKAPEADIGKNPFPSIFIGDSNSTFILFQKFIENDISDPYTDYSYIFQQMKKDGFIMEVKHKTFYNWLLKENYITKKDFEKFENNLNLKSLQKSHSEKRLNKYLILKEAYCL